MSRRFFTYDERPELRERRGFLREAWPAFMLKSPVSNDRWHLLYELPGVDVDPGSIADWQHWTGMRFPESGSYVVPGALQPIEIDVEADRGIYVEPNVWMHHKSS